MINLLSAVLVILAVGLYLLDSQLRQIRKASERSAIANELAAIYTREICGALHEARKATNGRGELLIWQDPADDLEYARSVLRDLDDRAERRRKREERYGPDPLHHPFRYDDPEAEARNAAGDNESEGV